MERDAITPETLAEARDLLRRWLRHWDVLAEGMPSEANVTQLLRSIIGCGMGQKIDPLEVGDNES